MNYDPPNNSDSDSDIAMPSDMPDEYYQGIRKAGNIRRVVVDKQGCIGARSCAVVAPLAFQMDDDDLAYVPEGHSDVEEDILTLAAQSCPVLAIHLYDKDGKKVFPKE
ncbi:ferredoxin [Candidatus Peregrinibacteria bacterium]|jgi:ferredoxin|nr:ferredoxin [Candidatus Peregrinibacteria bacterium]